ncbi:MAG TPA: hypothetical protein DCM28_16270 [Phycisphaerales bacterium]|nr:hypothetical protein [Phycisphaerales bacterium]HCD35411.1 hypothetical protein [Phycisphaerales bacterium]|tara:strand:- start:303 stop:515 length:213 start_codon:yes stop_codon:yes gene_type:complete
MASNILLPIIECTNPIFPIGQTCLWQPTDCFANEDGPEGHGQSNKNPREDATDVFSRAVRLQVMELINRA